MNNQARNETWTRFAGLLTVMVGGLVLAGWAIDIDVLKSIRPGWVSMKANAALAFVLTGLALLLPARLALLCGLLSGLLGLLTLNEYDFGWDPGIDQWLYSEASGAVGTSHPGRMAPDTALCFVLLAAGSGIAGVSRNLRRASVARAILGLLETALALTVLAANFTLAIDGWWGVTSMAVPTAVVFAALGAAVVLGSWQDALGSRLTPFSRHLWQMLACVGALAVAFTLYVRSEQQMIRAHELRHRSYLLADELRQSGDDLTRMVRTYAATGQLVFKQRFQYILDIRDGKRQRPENYSRPYLDLWLPGGPAPRPDSPQVTPLLELMRQAGFSQEEFDKLAEAKANSDALTIPEFEAMKLVESVGPLAEANRRRSLRMLYSDPIASCSGPTGRTRCMTRRAPLRTRPGCPRLIAMRFVRRTPSECSDSEPDRQPGLS